MKGALKLLENLSPQEKRALLRQLLVRRMDGAQKLFEQVATNVTELRSEAILDPMIRLDGAAQMPVGEPAHIFLTGATGFLGAFLLSELLQHTKADMYCLVRSSGVEEGQKKLHSTLASYALWQEEFRSRIIPVPGDLSEPLLGLSATQFQMLAGRIDWIYHSGAAVNWVYPYERLKPTNVLGTQEILRLACHTRVKPVHFISSLGVFPLVGNTDVQVVREADSLDHGGVLYGGYAQSKWVAEKLVITARARGVPVCIYRPGMITGHSQTGTWNVQDVTCRMIRTWVDLGDVPDMPLVRVDLTPMDYVSKAIVHLSRQRAALGKVFHLVNPRSVRLMDMVAWIRSFGYPLRQVPYKKWLGELLERAKSAREDMVASVVPLFSLSISKEVPSLFREIPRFDCQNTLESLAGTAIVCPPIEGPVFETYLAYFIQRGFLTPPPLGGTFKGDFQRLDASGAGGQAGSQGMAQALNGAQGLAQKKPYQ
jgi:thioester reductase-like protein